MNLDELRICQIEVSHIGDLIRLGEETNLSRWTAQSYIDELKNPNAIMLRLVEEQNELIGFVVGRIVPGGEIEARLDAEIYNIAVTEAHRGTGCAQMLFDAFTAKCRERDVENIWLEVRESNGRAIKFYEKNGFEGVQTRASFYSDPREHALVMRLILK